MSQKYSLELYGKMTCTVQSIHAVCRNKTAATANSCYRNILHSILKSLCIRFWIKFLLPNFSWLRHLKKPCSRLGVHTFNPSTNLGGRGRQIWVQGQPDLQSKFKVSQGYTESLPLSQKRSSHCLYSDEAFMAKIRSFSGNCPQNTEVIKSVRTHYCIVL